MQQYGIKRLFDVFDKNWVTFIVFFPSLIVVSIAWVYIPYRSPSVMQ